MTARVFDARRAAAWLAFALLIALFAAVGCSDDKSDPTYPETPQPPTGNWFLGIWGTGLDDIYVVGQPGLIYHWDGTAWERQDSPTSKALTSVWGDGSGDVYITGHDGVILRETASGWDRMDSGTEVDLFDVCSYQGTTMIAGRDGVVLQLSGSSWSRVPNEAFIRDAEQVVIDTLYIDDDEDDDYVESYTTVVNYGVAGADGAVLMEDPETAWQLRRITGGQDWITCGHANDRISGNFIATNGGRLFQLGEADSRLVWNERFSPAVDAIVYGIHAGTADTVWAVANDGRISRVDPDNGHDEINIDSLILFDIWGEAGELFAVGIDARILHFHEINPGEYGWEAEDLPDLPAGKSLDDTFVFDKFGRPVH